MIIKQFFSGLFKILCLMGLTLWLCFVYPDQVTAFFESLGRVVPIFLFTAIGLGLLVSFLASFFTPSSPPSSAGQPPAVVAPPPAPRRSSATPFLLGLALGWWLGHPGHDGDDC